MSYQRWRDEFMAGAAKAGVATETARALLRASTTLDRLAVAQCNGDWPADNGERTVKPCVECESLWVPSSLSRAGVCQDCRTEARVRALELPEGVTIQTSGDPRGCVLRLVLADGRELGVPAR